MLVREDLGNQNLLTSLNGEINLATYQKAVIRLIEFQKISEPGKLNNYSTIKTVKTPDREFLTQLRISIPFLQEIPDDLYFGLDIAELYVPNGKVAEVRLKLEGALNSFVMTYKKNVFNLSIPIEKHLCANIKSASLSPDQKELLDMRENELVDLQVNFIVYEKPLVFINPKDSPIAHYYKPKGQPS